MLKIAICDDDAAMCDILKQKVTFLTREFEELAQISCHTDTAGLEDSLFGCDILLLDIQMPGVNGIEFAKKLREAGNCCSIIFVTVLKESVYDAFEVEAVDYICKPVDDARLKNALFRAARRSEDRGEKVLFIQTMNWCRQVKLSAICYCEVINRKVYLHTRDGVIEYYSKLEEVEGRLDYRFVRCHRSYIVNLDYLREYADGQITLESGDRVPVSRSRQRKFMSSMRQYMLMESPIVNCDLGGDS